jgi:NADPH:quinone reductase-like Zn-dependent oxidoreductase
MSPGSWLGSGLRSRGFAVGDAIFGMIATNQDGAWAAGGVGGYALVREYAAAPKPEALSFTDAASKRRARSPTSWRRRARA